MLAAAQASSRLVQVGHIEHFNPVMAFLEKEVTDPRFITTERLALQLAVVAKALAKRVPSLANASI